MLLTAVEVEDTDELEEMEEDELDREMVFRGIKTPLTSSEFMGFRDWPPLSPHADRLMLAKLGGLATAVMRKDSRWSGKRDGWTGREAAVGKSVGVAEVVSSHKTTPCAIAAPSVAGVVSQRRGRQEASKTLMKISSRWTRSCES